MLLLVTADIGRSTGKCSEEIRLYVEWKLVQLKVFAVDGDRDVREFSCVEKLGEIHVL